MDYILNYINFNESKGISDSCELVLYDIWKEIKQNITSQESNSFKLNIDKEDFKIKDLIIKYKFSPSSENNCYGTTHLKDSSIENNYLINSYIELDLKVNNLDNEFIYYIKSVLLHELLHLFQHYNIKIKNKFRPESFSIGSILPQLRPLVKTKYGNYILDIIYFSLSHELSAQLHQYYMYRLSNKEYKKIFKIRDSLNNFIPKEMDSIESKEIEMIKNHISKSIKYFSSKKYIKNVKKSLWDFNDVIDFINELSDIVKYKVKWIDKKIKLIDSKTDNISENNIRYDITISLPTNWEDHDKFEIQRFIKNNLNDCKIVNGI
jgi:hypothetical protein